jgi:hypothetical protein
VLAALLSGVTATAGTQQINLSRDLISLGIASQNLLPDNPNLDARPLVQTALSYAKKNGTRWITVDTGKYYFLTPQTFDRYLEVNAFTDLIIDFAGSDLYFKNREMIGLILSDCQRVTLTNFTVDFLNLPFTQVRLTGVDQRTLSYETLSGWTNPTTFNTAANPYGNTDELWALVFRDGNIVPGTNRLPLTGPIASGVLQVQKQDSPWTQPAVLATYRPGDIIVVTARGGEAPIYVSGGDHVTLSDINVYASSAIAVHLDTIQDATVFAVNVIPRPDTDRLISSNADGIHLSFAQANNRVRVCHVSRTMDDGIAINSPFLAFVTRQNSARQISVTRNFGAVFPNGLNALFVDPNTGAALSGAHITSQNPPFSDPPSSASPVTVTFDRDLPTLSKGFGMIFGDAANRGAGSMIEYNVVEDVLSARGIYLGGVSGVTVHNNTVRRSDCGGIVVHQDLASYPVGPSQNLRIMGNVVDSAIGMPAVGTGTIAAIGSIFVLTTDPNFNFISNAPNTNINISGNYVVNSGRAGVWMANVSGGTIQNNLVVQYGQQPRQPIWGIASQFIPQLLQDFTQAVVLRFSASVAVQSNQY